MKTELINYFINRTKNTLIYMDIQEVIETVYEKYPLFFEVIYKNKIDFTSYPVFIMFFLLVEFFEYDSAKVRSVLTDTNPHFYKSEDMKPMVFYVRNDNYILDNVEYKTLEGLVSNNNEDLGKIGDMDNVVAKGFPTSKEINLMKKLLKMNKFPKIPSFYIPTKPSQFELRFLSTYLYCRFMNFPYNGGFIFYLSSICTQLTELLSISSFSYNTFKNFTRRANEYLSESLGIPFPSYDLKSITKIFMSLYDSFSNTGINRLVVDIKEILDASEFFYTYHKDLIMSLSEAVQKGDKNLITRIIDIKFYAIYRDYKTQKIQMENEEDEI